MCTAVSFKTKDHYFGRNLDLEYHYNETVTISPRNYPFHFRKLQALKSHYAMVGIATVDSNYPLYYEATNEKGLSVAGLNFPDNADYKPSNKNANNIAPFELIPYILGKCKSVAEAEYLLSNINIAQIPFSEKYPLSPLHWIISDKYKSLTVESVDCGLKVYDNPTGVLTNNPTFDFQMFNLNNYINITPHPPTNTFSENLNLNTYSAGMGGIGLPGDSSSTSRFVKAVFTKMNSVSGHSESESLSQFFHILSAVEVSRGSVKVGNGKHEITLYSSCCNTDKGIFYYKTYENSQISAVNMHNENLDSEILITYPLISSQQINLQN